jgi:superfamily II DNA helicase RecQ
MILASPEVLLRDGSHFWLKTSRNKNNPFCMRLKAVVVDESHLVWGWKEFRKDYLNIGGLRANKDMVCRIPVILFWGLLAN